ncbi:hypothetical protein C0993_012345 [Termitomyces sp. T159_Od127]|nr:hypothetical protein C0993_012345 [Termitomyces sp. T159_Od127]
MTWTDPQTGETFIVDSRTGNSYPQTEESSGEVGFTGVDRCPRRTIPCRTDVIGTQNNTDKGRPPEWLQKALQENRTYEMGENMIQKVSSRLLNETVDQPFNAAHKFHEFRSGLAGSVSQKHHYRFRKQDLRRAVVINQVDTKFIACLIEDYIDDDGESLPATSIPSAKGHVLILVDQHAADERIRVERFLNDLCSGFLHSRNGKDTDGGVQVKELSPPLPVLLTLHEAQRLTESLEIREAFRSWGFQFLAHIDPGTGGNIGIQCTPYVDSWQVLGSLARQPLDIFQDAAESLSINISDVVASALASDVEYRIHQVIEEAARFMRHGRRTTLTTSDIEQAFRVLNIEPLYGHTPANPPVFRRALPFPHIASAGPVYFVEDEEIDFDRVLREEKITLPKGVSWTAHWLAVEGVQPLVPENPPAIPRDAEPDAAAAKPETLANGNGPLAQGAAVRRQQQQQQQQQQLVKQVLSRELQLYYSRLTESLIPPSNDFAKRTAALASLRGDAGLQALLPYLIRWVGEGVVSSLREGVQSESDGRVLEVMMDVVSALLENNTLFVEPYVRPPYTITEEY